MDGQTTDKRIKKAVKDVAEHSQVIRGEFERNISLGGAGNAKIK